MLWFTLSFLTALFSATEAAAVKRWLGDLTSSQTLACMMGWSLPFFFAHWLVLGIQPVGDGFWTDLAIFLPINIAGAVVQYEAICSAPLSLTIPFMAFTPAFMIVTGFIFLGELPSLVGSAGIVLIVIGSWVLNSEPGNGQKLLDPFRAILRERGSRYALGAAFIWSLGAVYSKRLAVNADPLYAGIVFFCIHNCVLVLGIFLLGKAKPSILITRARGGIVCAAILYAHILCHYAAIARVTAAYMISIKRLNGIISVIYGAVFFGDKDVGKRMVGAVIMAAGAAVIALLG